MHICNDSESSQRTDQVFKFFMRGDSVTRMTVTIHAQDVDVAWNWLHTLFPGTDLTNTVLQHSGHISHGHRAVQAQPGSAML